MIQDEPRYYLRGLTELDLILLTQAIEHYQVPWLPTAAFPQEKVQATISLRRKLNRVLYSILRDATTNQKPEVSKQACRNRSDIVSIKTGRGSLQAD